MSPDNPLRVHGILPGTHIKLGVEIDEYVPLRIRVSPREPGAGFIRMGDYQRSLLEIRVDPQTQHVCSLTVTIAPRVSTWHLFDLVSSQTGLPRVSAVLGEWQRMDLTREFTVAVRAREILVFWNELGQCVSASMGDVHFLIAEGALAGVWLTEVSAAQIEMFESACR
jgi:hypothetical protein